MGGGRGVASKAANFFSLNFTWGCTVSNKKTVSNSLPVPEKIESKSFKKRLRCSKTYNIPILFEELCDKIEIKLN